MPKNPLMPTMSPAPTTRSSSMGIVVPLLGLVLFGAGAGLGWMVGSRSEFKKGYDQAYGEAKAKIEEAGVFGQEGFPVTRLEGGITNVGSDFIEIEVQPLARNPLDEPSPTKRRVTVTSETRIQRSTQKSAETLQKEYQDYEKASERYRDQALTGDTLPPPPIPPDAFTTEEVKVSDLEVGMSVSVISATDVAMEETFTATEIIAREVSQGPAVIVGPEVLQPPVPPPSPTPAP